MANLSSKSPPKLSPKSPKKRKISHTPESLPEADEGLKAEPADSYCELCGRTGLVLIRHHLIPQSRHNKARTQRAFSRAVMKTQIAMLCRPCHSQIHEIFDNHELAAYYHSIERLATHSEVAKFVKWVKKRPAGLKVRVR